MIEFNPLTFQTGPIHFIGIGGIGMSGIAEILHNMGYRVQGSDQKKNVNCERLEKLGVKVFLGHSKENLGSARYVVVSSAISEDNVELREAKAHNLVILKRAEMLAELMRLKWSIAVAGTHGKTTTTSLIASILKADQKDPTVINGGIINSYGTNAYLGNSPWMVVEADESDGSFQLLPAMITIVTNIDPEHLDFYQDYDSLKEAFFKFVHQIPFYGFGVLCYDHPAVREMVPQLVNRRIITYGLKEGANLQAKNISYSEYGTSFSISFLDPITEEQFEIEQIWLPMLGEHNIQNALAGLAVGYHLGIPWETMKKGLSDFTGVRRRFTQVASIDGIKIIDDYGHHPVEIAAALKAARSASTGKVVAVVQPHRYSRLVSLLSEFCECLMEADIVYVSEVYAAGESEVEEYSHKRLIHELTQKGHKNVEFFENTQKFVKEVLPQIQSGDVIIFLGAGTITQWAHQCPKELLLCNQT